ncbi:unnamed protein product [Rotaria sp. Silwood1]|nr:unnamed protein product [Rotaria sp. Silwood1]
MSVSTLTNVRLNIGRYGLSTIIVLGNISNILTTLIFIRVLRKQLNSCTMYLLASSIANIILIDTAVISSLYGIDHPDPIHLLVAFCKLKFYGPHVLLMLSRSFKIASCIDRWALTSSNVRIRSFSQPKIARNVIIFLMLIWPIIPIFLAILSNIYSGRCSQPSYYAFPISMYSFIFVGSLPPLLMFLFGLLTWRNLKEIRSRIAPENDSTRYRLQRCDRDLMKMVAGETLVYLITTMPYPVNSLYGIITASIAQQKSEMRLAIETLISYIISQILIYIYYVTPFYVYSISSKKFRGDFVRFIRCQSML